jgi:hypothetical protein
MRIIKLCFLILNFLLITKCNPDKKGNSGNFKLQIAEESKEQIQPFKVANIMPYFKDGSIREYKEENFDWGKILTIQEN